MFLFDFRNRREIRLLDALAKLRQHDDHRHKELYEILGILDSKAASLMVFNSVIAIVTAEPFFASSTFKVIILATIFLSSASSVLGFFVVRVAWPFLGKAQDYESELSDLEKEVDRRTRLYQIAWLISLASVILLILVILDWLI